MDENAILLKLAVIDTKLDALTVLTDTKLTNFGERVEKVEDTLITHDGRLLALEGKKAKESGHMEIIKPVVGGLFGAGGGTWIVSHWHMILDWVAGR